MLASMPTFYSLCMTKAGYDEVGPAIARASAVFGESAV